MNDSQILDDNLNVDYDKEGIELVSLNKFILLNLCSLGLYAVWWQYKLWKFFKEKDNLDVIPVARALFSIFFIYSLFEKIKDFSNANGNDADYSSGGLVTGFIILNVLSRLPDPFWLVSLGSFLFLIPPFNAFNYSIKNSDTYHGIERSGLSTRQIILLIVGGLVLLLAILGLFAPEDGSY